MAKSRLVILFTTILFLLNTNSVKAENYANIVNIVRISPYTQNLSDNVSAQIENLERNKLQATWLLTYDALNDEETVDLLKKRSNDEFGLWLEIGPDITSALEIEYKNNLAWHYANNVFLSAYKKEQRINLIDEYFKKYHDLFETYPTSVGSWWTDAYSLTYMQEKYAITANVGVADQFSTDHYQVWGQHWSIPFFLNINNPAIPQQEQSKNNSIVNIQWAPRDPLNGYYNSLYSFQDYKVHPLTYDTDYFKKLVDFYINIDTSINQITVGLESDLSDTKAYDENSEYNKQLEYIKYLVDENTLQATTINKFANKFIDKRNIDDSVTLQSNEFGDKEIIWHQNKNYRVGIRIDRTVKELEIFDLRFYDKDFKDPYFYSPNRELNLSIYNPSVIDEFQDNAIWKLDFENINISTEDSLIINSDKFNIEFLDDEIVFSDNVEIPKYVSNNPLILIANNAIKSNDDAFKSEDFYIWGFSSEFRYFLSSTKKVIFYFLLFSNLIIITLLIFRKNKYRILAVIALLLVVTFYKNYNLLFQRYYVSQSELDTLYKLHSLDPGIVLISDQDCLQCSYHTPAKPAVFSNTRRYVEDVGSKKVLQSNEIFSQNRESIKGYLRDNNIKYIYFVRYEDYKEDIPYQVGDLGVRLIYSNANTKLWEVLD